MAAYEWGDELVGGGGDAGVVVVGVAEEVELEQRLAEIGRGGRRRRRPGGAAAGVVGRRRRLVAVGAVVDVGVADHVHVHVDRVGVVERRTARRRRHLSGFDRR